MPSPPTIRVVVVNWNRRELLQACLQSLARQTHPSYEVCVVDNGSNDGSAEWIVSLIPAFPVPLHLIRNSENRGFCAANNQGFAAVENEFIALLNNDAEADPNWLTALEASIRRSDDIGMVASKILVWEDPKRTDQAHAELARFDGARVEPARIDKAGHVIWLDGQNRGRGTGQLDRGQFDHEEEVLWPDGCAALYRRAMLDEVGGFDEDFFAYADDAELGLRARWAGWRCLYAPLAVVRHHRGATLGLGSARRLTLIERNRVWLVVKQFPWDLLWLNGVYLAARIGAGMWAALRNRGEIRHYPGMAGKWTAAWGLLRGTLSALPRIPTMLAKRRRLRPLRRLTSRQMSRLLRAHQIALRELSEQAN